MQNMVIQLLSLSFQQLARQFVVRILVINIFTRDELQLICRINELTATSIFS